MEDGEITFGDGAGGVDLRATLESGQSFLWRRTDGELYEAPAGDGEPPWYYAVVDNDVVFVRQCGADARRPGADLRWRATTDAGDLLRRRLRLDDDLDAIFAGFPDDPTLAEARRAFPGLRVVRDPFFPCLVSFICSARTSVERIHALQTDLARAYGDAVAIGGTTYRAFPRPDQLAAATEGELRDLGLGFRAPYVAAAARRVAAGELTMADLGELSYPETTETLQSFRGVGPKIADCVALFACGHLEAVPVDRWTRRLIERYVPDVAGDSYETTASAFRRRFGAAAGYAQTYLYHYVRSSATSG